MANNPVDQSASGAALEQHGVGSHPAPDIITVRSNDSFQPALDQGHPMAQLQLADCYYNGIGVDRDRAKAFESYRKLANDGIHRAQVAVGRYYADGEGIDQDFNTAIEWYSKAAAQGSEDGRLHIVFLQAWFSFIGRGVEQSDVAAFNRWQEVSTNSTDPVMKPIATHMVGWMHYLGRGTVRDEQKGIKTIRDSKSLEFHFGEDECLARGEAISSNSTAARTFFGLCQLGSDQDWLCRHLMAICLFHGFGAPRDAKAAEIFEQLANDGHSDCQYWIGSCCFHGWGTSWNHTKAYEWFIKSANQDNSYGQFMAGVCSKIGLGVDVNHADAFEWFRKSAERGNQYGQVNLGDCYKDASGVDKNTEAAVFWYRKSAEQGSQRATNELKSLGL